MRADYIIVGSGITGAVLARQLSDAGQKVLVLERRPHLGGNVHDHTHASGIRIHTYGPHYFRTNSDKLWAFITRFASFYKYEAALKTHVDSRFENWPIDASTIQRMAGTNWQPAFRGEPTNFEEASLSMMPRLIYEKFVKGYTEKQWGVPAQLLSRELAGRFEVRHDSDTRLKRHTYQGIPLEGYAGMMKRMLADIPVLLNCDYLRHRNEFKAGKLRIFTGPIDEYFGFDLGRLKYRGQQRSHQYMPDVDFIQPCGQINNPDPSLGPHIRTLEWKHMMPLKYAAMIRGTVLTREVTITPTDPNSYEYPFPDSTNSRLYASYRKRAEQIPDLLVCGRLGEYRYYDMDQAMGRALKLAERILSRAEKVEPARIE